MCKKWKLQKGGGGGVGRGQECCQVSTTHVTPHERNKTLIGYNALTKEASLKQATVLSEAMGL